jgi:hypothetical protein
MKAKIKECVHHWEIAVAQGPLSKGICLHCRITKDFKNSIFTDTSHITLEKERPDASQNNEEGQGKWNRWFGD